MADSGATPASESPVSRSEDNGYTPGDSSGTYWRNVFSYMSGKMTPDGVEQFRVAKDLQNEAKDCKRCEDQRDYLLQYSASEPRFSTDNSL
jgi:mitochondrial inner membrane protease ATP23